ncbi:Uncharacterised protein [Mycobacteroides abscessus subsp. abscessus]|nr:Uncharacterised protein [Mycobacteroides abscessus subsp. abscessus]
MTPVSLPTVWISAERPASTDSRSAASSVSPDSTRFCLSFSLASP